MDKLYDIYFHFNIYKKEWNAVPRDKAVDYLNGNLKAEDVLKNKDINNLIKYDTATLQYLEGRLVEAGAVGSAPNVFTSTSASVCVTAIGRLMGQCSDMNTLWIQRCNPACEAVVEGGWKFGASYLADVDSFKVGTRVTIHDLTFRCLPDASGILFTQIGTATPS
jgi:hypothetical protein